MHSKDLPQLAKSLTIKVHEPFAAFLNATSEETDFEISLLDCYRFAGHACHSMTGAFLITKAAIEQLYPETNTCRRGDLQVEFGSELSEAATGPRSNLISYITGAWGETGFGGFRGQFSRKNLVSYGHADLQKNEVRFKRVSTNESVIVKYDSSLALKDFSHPFEFPDSWREEVAFILKNNSVVVRLG